MRFVLVACLSILMLFSGTACFASDSKEADVSSDSESADCSIEVTDIAPDGFADTTRPVLSATLSSKCGNDIDVESVEMLLNEEVVPCEITVKGTKVSVEYLPEWSLAQSSDHYVAVRAKDKKGNTVEKEWSFWLGLIY